MIWNLIGTIGGKVLDIVDLQARALAVRFALPSPPHPLPLVPVPLLLLLLLLLLQGLGLIPLLRNRQRIPRRVVIFGKYAEPLA